MPPSIPPIISSLAVNLPGLTTSQNKLLNDFEDFFVAGAVTSRVSQALNKVGESFVFRNKTGGDGIIDDASNDDHNSSNTAAEESVISAHDHPGAQRNFALFMEFADFIDSLVEEFVVQEATAAPASAAAAAAAAGDGDTAKPTTMTATTASPSRSDDILTDLAELCNALVDSPEAASFVSIPYVAAALDFEQFVQLVFDTWGDDADEGEDDCKEEAPLSDEKQEAQ